MTGMGTSGRSVSNADFDDVQHTRRSAARRRRGLSLTVAIATGASLLAVPSPVAAQVIIPDATTFTEPFDDDNFTDFSATTAEWNDGFLTYPGADPTYDGVKNNAVQISPDFRPWTDLAIGDVDSDGNDDLVAVSDQTTRWFPGTGGPDPFAGVVGVDIGTDLGTASDVELTDLDGDGDLDVLVVYPAGDPGLVVHTNSGTSTPFTTAAPRTIANTVGFQQVVSGHFNDDTDIDIVSIGNDLWYFENNGDTIPFNGQFPRVMTTDNLTAVIPADLNRDGQLDLVVGTDAGEVRWYGNEDGPTAFIASAPFELIFNPSGSPVDALAVGDLDGDGPLEVFIDVAGQDQSQVGVVLFDTETFEFLDGSVSSMAVEAGIDVTAVEIIDIDNDGDRDIVQVANDGVQHQYRWFQNDGTEDWWQSALLFVPSVSSQSLVSTLAVADLDRDGDVDSVVGAANSANPAFDTLRYYDNDGSPIPLVPAGTSTGFPNAVFDVEALDYDADGDVDYVVSPGDNSNLQFFANTGTGAFANPVGLGADGTSVFGDLDIGDVDRDGRPDVAAVAAQPDPAVNQVLIAGAPGTPASLQIRSIVLTPHANSVLLADVNGDGADDLVVGTDGTVLPNVTLNDRVGPDFFDTGVTFELDGLLGTVTRLQDSGDIDGDGFDDLLVTTSPGSQFAYYRGDESGATRRDLGPGSAATQAIFTDVDGDGDLDVVTQASDGDINRFNNFAGNTIGGSPITMYSGVAGGVPGLAAANFDERGVPDYFVTNDGGALVAIVLDGINSALDLTTPNPVDRFVIGDFDGDGDEDVQVFEATARRFDNISTGPPRAVDRPTSSASASGVVDIAPIDLEGDNDVDVITVGTDGVVVFDSPFGGDFPFTAARTDQLRPDNDYVDVAVGDIDNDGDPDAVASKNNGQVTLFRNDGTGGFDTPVDLTFDTVDETNEIQLGDLNSDGDLDIVLLQVDAGTSRVRTLIGVGGGLFPGTPSDFFESFVGGLTDMVLDDVDRDGDPDVVVAGNTDESAQLVLNIDGTAGDTTTLSTPLFAVSSVDTGDINNDGYPDVVIGQQGGDSVVYLNTPANGGDFTGAAGSTVGAAVSGGTDVSLIDVDGDGQLDLVTASAGQGLVEVAYGDGTAAFANGTSDVYTGGFFSQIAAFELDGDRGAEIVIGNGADDEIVTSQNPALLSEAGNQARSDIIVAVADPIARAAIRFAAGGTVDVNEVDVWLTNNGTNWFEVDEGETFTFPTVGSTLRFRTEFADDRLADAESDPRQRIDELNIEFADAVVVTPTVDVSLTVTPGLADAGPSAVPLEALAPEVLQEASDEGSDIAALPLSSIDLLPSDDPTIEASPLSSLPLSSIPLSSLPLSSIPLSDVPIDAPGGWDGVLERARANGETELIGAPLQNVTFADVAELSEVQALPLSSIDLAATPLSSIPLSSIALGATPLSSIDIGPFPQAWCDLLESPEFGFDCAVDFGIAAGDTETDVNIVDLAVEGAPLSSIPLSSVPLSSLPLSSLPLSSVPLSSVELDSTPLSSIPLSSIPLSSIELAASPLSSIPLSSLPLSSVPLSSIPLSSLDLTGTPLSSVPLSSIDIAGSPLSSIPLSSLPLSSLPLSSLPLSSVPLSSLPLSSLPLSSVFIDSVPLSSIPLSSIDIAGSPLSSIPLSSLDLTGTPLSSVPLSSLPLSSLPLSSIPLSSIDIAGSPLSSIPLSSIDIAGSPLSSIPLSSIPLSSIGDVVDCNLIDCTDERNTLFQAFLNGAIQPDAELGDLEDAFADIRHDDLVGSLTGIDRDAYDTAVRAALDDAAAPATVLAELLAQGRGDGLLLGDLPADLPAFQTTTFVVLLAGLAGLDYSALGPLLAQVALGPDLVDFTDVVDVDDATLGELLSDPDQNPPAGAFFDQVVLQDLADAFTGLRLSDLAAIFGVNEAQLAQDLNGITGTLADVQEFDDLTLGELLVYGGATLNDLFAALALANPPVLDAILLGELLVGLLAVTDYPWDIVDFEADDLVSFDDTASNVEYTALVSTSDATGEKVELRVTLPPGSPYVPGSTSITAAPTVEPEIQGGDLVWTFGVVSPATAVSVVFEARPPLNLASHPAEATARLLDTSIEANSLSTFTLTEANEPNDTPPTATPVAEGNAYFAHITSSDDVDVFAITVPAVGSRLSINLSNLDADLDLALFAPPGGGFLGADTQNSIVPVDDDGINALDNDDEVDAQVAQDLALIDLPLHQTSLQRGLGDEQIDTAPLNRSGTWYIQVTGFNGATTIDPYVLRAKVLAPITGVPCAARTFPFAGTPGVAGPIGASVDTLFLVNEQRLGAVYGPAEAASIRTRLDDLVRALTAPGVGDPDLTGLDVTPAILPVESDAAVAAAYAAWDSASGACSPDAANNVVSAISDLVEGIRVTNELRHVVVVGGDELVPFARVPDATTIANERSYASTFSGENNALVGALAGGFVLTDDVYGDADPIAFGDRTLYVPDVALGRLVESPAEIIGTLDGFLGHGGTLDPDTGLVTGYDFLTDGADAIIGELEGAITDGAGNPLDPNVLNNDVWGRADLRDALVPAVGDGPDVASVNAHFDHYRSLPADGNASQDETDLFEVSDLAQGIPGGLEGSIVFSMGCHSGFTVNDELVPFGDVRAGDWAQALSARGAIYVGNTGYGYGDTEIVAYSEELMARFAGNLDGSVTAGEALMFAKNAYIGGLAAVGVYDEKSAMQATFYGLPFYTLDEVAPSPPPAPAQLPEADPLAAGTPSAPIQLDETFERVDGPDGTYWFWNDGGVESTQAVHFRPIQPKVVADVTSADPTLEARGAMLTVLESLDVPGIDPVIVRPTIDLSANEPEPDSGQIADPAVLQAVSAEFTPEGDRQRIVTSGGQFDGTAEVGTQRLFTSIGADVYYADPANSDRLPPVIESIDGVELGSDVSVSVEVSDESNAVVRVTMLFVVEPGPGVEATWQLVELAQDPATGTWGGAVPNPGGEIEYFVQAVDAAGNVAVSSDKGLLYEAAEVAAPPADLEPLLARVTDSNGWYTSPVSVSIPDPSPFTVSVSVSGGEPFAYEGPVTVNTSGNRRVEFRRNDGLVAEVIVPVDLAQPAAVISRPVLDAEVPAGDPVVTRFSCSDVGSGIASCTGLLDGIPVATGSSRTDLDVGPHTLVVTSVDIAGNSTQTSRDFTVIADEVDPTIEISSPENGDAFAIGEDITITFECDDDSGTVDCTADIDGDPVTSGAIRSYAAVGSRTLTVDAVDGSGNDATASVGFTIEDRTDPTVSIDSPADGATFSSGPASNIDVSATCSDADSGIASCALTFDGNPVGSPGTGSATASIPTTTAGLGDHVIEVTGVDAAGNDATASIEVTVIDDDAPEANALTPVDGSIVGPEVTVTFSCSADSVSCDAMLDDDSVDSGDTVTLSEGGHSLVVTATDGAGNEGQDVSTFVVDATAPLVEIDAPADGESFRDDESVTVTFSCTEAPTATASGLGSCEALLDGNTSVESGDVLDDLAVGSHTLVVTGSDLVGNDAQASVAFTITETVAPTVGVSQPADGDTFGLAVGGSIDVVAACGDDGSGMASCSLTVDGDPVGIPGSIMAIASIPVTVAGVGAHVITVIGVDNAGNEAAASITITVIDDLAPEASVQTPVDGSIVGGDVTVTYSCSDDSVSCVGVLDGSPVATGDTVTLTEGEHTLVVTATDAADNEGEATSTFVVDTTAPAVEIASPLDGVSVPENETVAVSFTCTEDTTPLTAGVASCDAVLDGVTGVADGAALDDLAVGSHTIVVTGADAVGNEATATVDFEVTEVVGLRRALFVSRAAQPPASDRPVIALLEDAGFEVEVVDDRLSRVSDAEDKDVVVISASVSSFRVGARFRDIDVPVVTWEGFLHAAMGFNQFGGFRNGETRSRFIRSVDVANPEHPVAAGLDGRVAVNTVGRRHSFSRVEGDAVVVGTVPGAPGLASVFAYEEGSAMRGDLTAPARRVGLFMDAQGTSRLTADGEAIVLAAVEWAIAPPIPFNLAPEVDLGPDVDTTVGAVIDLDAIVSDDALPTLDAPTVTWNEIVGPGSADFTSVDTTATSVSFDEPGVYVLELVADDGERTTAERIRVTVAPATVDETILYVGANARPLFVDRIVIAHFESLGYTVEPIADDQVRRSVDLTGIDLIFVSATIDPRKVADEFADTDIPVLLNERRLLDDLEMAGPPIRISPQTSELQIVAPEHPLAAGFDGDLNFVKARTRVGMGVPSDDAVVVATAFGQPTLFSYVTGDDMIGRVAPANRVFFPGTSRTPVALNDAGFALLTQAVNVALS